jgi:hypothetical protein
MTDVDTAGVCDTCGGRKDNPDDLQRRTGDNTCEQCDALLTAAHALLDNNVLDEATILGTLAFAWSKDAWAADPGDYGVFEFLTAADGVPLLRLPNITTRVITYDGGRIPNAVKINVYSRDVKPQELAEVYERLLKNQKIHFDRCSAGSMAWKTERATLTLTVRAMKEPDPGRVSSSKTYPAGRGVYSFPPPTLVGGFYRALLGSTHKKTFSGYAYALAESGRHPPQQAVIGGVAWLLGENNKAIPPRERRPRIAKTLNKHLFAPRDERKLPEDYWTSDDTLWRAASTLGPRLMRNLYHLQESRQQQFS